MLLLEISLINLLFTTLWALLAKLTLTTLFYTRDSFVFDEQLLARELLCSHFGASESLCFLWLCIVDGETAELTLARRLAEKNVVAVIEADSFYKLNNDNLIEISTNASYYLEKNSKTQNPLIDWNQRTTSQLDFEEISMLYSQERTLDEDSVRNFMWYQRRFTNSYQK